MKELLKNKPLLAVLFVQTICIVIAFNKFFSRPMNYMFKNHGDSLKNYYNLYNYVRPENKEFSLFSFHAYPYGDYIFYTDNTPLLAFPMKVFSTYIFDLTPYAIPIFNLFCIISLLFSTILLFKILTRLISVPWLVFFFTIVLTWLNPQTFRFHGGHANLGYSFVLLLNIWLLIRFFDERQARPIVALRSLVYLFLTIFLSSFFHVYYAGILAVFTSLGLGAWALTKFKRPLILLGRTLFALVFSAAAVACVLLVIKSVDQYYDLRLSVPQGYDWIEWKIKSTSFYSAYARYNTFVLPFADQVGLESRGYLGAFNLFGAAFFLLLLLWRETRDQLKRAFRQLNRDSPWVMYFLFAGFFSLMISLGHSVKFGEVKLTNYLNPFYYFAFFTDAFKQFRCLGRFYWFFYWSFSLPIIYLIAYFWRYSSRYFVYISLTFLLGLTLVETVDFISFQNEKPYPNRLQNAKELNEANILLEGVDLREFQAILPIPFWHSHSDDFDYTIDADEDYFAFCSQISTITGLPLMSARIGRASYQHTKELFSIFTENEMAPNLRKRLKEQPILILAQKDFIADPSWANITGDKPSRKVVEEGHKIIERYQMKKLKEFGPYILYRWDLPQSNLPYLETDQN